MRNINGRCPENMLILIASQAMVGCQHFVFVEDVDLVTWPACVPRLPITANYSGYLRLEEILHRFVITHSVDQLALRTGSYLIDIQFSLIHLSLKKQHFSHLFVFSWIFSDN